MNLTLLTFRSPRTITLRDLVKPQLATPERQAIERALKNAKKEQDKIKKQASKISN